MEAKKKKSRYHIYIPWFTNDDAFYDEEDSGEESWVNYIRRNLKHPTGEESPFPYSSWSYTRHDSPFEKDDEEQLENRSDATIHEDAIKALYESEDLDASHIKLIVLNGIVLLFGTVSTLLEKNQAQRIVQSLPGVWNVRNEITIEKSNKRSLSQVP
jgi:hypothetical protein